MRCCLMLKNARPTIHSVADKPVRISAHHRAGMPDLNSPGTACVMAWVEAAGRRKILVIFLPAFLATLVMLGVVEVVDVVPVRSRCKVKIITPRW